MLVAASIVFAGLAYAQDDVCVIFGVCEEPPVVDEPVVDEPVVDEPVVDEPVVDEPVVDEPVVDEPVVDEPPVTELGCGAPLALPANASVKGKAQGAQGIERANEARCAQ
ncbi:MAG TPA: hypothetical protein VFB99_04060 [Vicinamibacterales bacterium]|nr:hypothetical protein [Vicinamibacterales bacterium]